MSFWKRFLELFRPNKIVSEEATVYYFGNDEYAKGQALLAQLKSLQRPIGRVSAQICE